MSVVAQLLTKAISTPVSNLEAATEGYSIVSFDVFDTLVKRNVRKPEDIFVFLERQMVMEFGDGCRGFASRRVQAEAGARGHKAPAEVTLDDVYAVMGLSDDVAARAKEVECALEERLCVPNKPLVSLLGACLERGQRVIIITDIYLSRTTIEAILAKCGISGYERLFVSSEVGSTKRDGSLFGRAFSDVGADPGSVVHIGDSLVSDYLNPRRRGAAAILIDRHRAERLDFAGALATCSTPDAGMVASFVANDVPDGTDYYRFGYECFGPYLMGFSKWLSKSLGNEGLSKVYFLSRDGYILERAFKIMYPEGFDCEYLEVSRRSLRIPMLRTLQGTQEIIDVMPPSQAVSVAEIFDTLGLEPEGHERLLGSLGLTADETISKNELSTDGCVSKLVEALRPEFSKRSQEQFEALEQYLATIGVGGRFAIVDIGWSGGMQRYLEDALRRMGLACDVSGYCTGIVAYATRNVKYAPLKLNGYVFDCLRDGAAADVRRFYVGFLETLFLEQDGTVIGYGHDAGGSPVALRGGYEYSDGRGGKLPEARHVRELQDGALDFLRDAMSSGIADIAHLTPQEAFCGIDEAGSNPSRRVRDMFADFLFFDDGAVGRLAAPRGLGHYLVHPARLKQDLLASRWKIAFAKRFLYGLPLPYRDILSKLAKGGE